MPNGIKEASIFVMGFIVGLFMTICIAELMVGRKKTYLYKQGQIDALEGRIYYYKVFKKDSSFIYVYLN